MYMPWNSVLIADFWLYSILIYHPYMQVIGKCLECPFHGWQYDGDTGQCIKIPYSSGKIPSQAKVKVWPSLETNGIIHVWFDAEGRDPTWFPPEFEEIKKGRWTYHGYSTHLINAHIEVSSACKGNMCVCERERERERAQRERE